MNKQSFFKVLSILGAIFIIFSLISYVVKLKTQGERIENLVEVPEEFSRHFGRILTSNRVNPIKRATFMSPQDNRLNWQVFRGKYVLVNFWATWCPPCVLELPSLNKLKDKFEDKGLEVIAISFDNNRDHNDIKEFLKNRSIGEFAAYFDDVGEVQQMAQVRGLPTTYLLGPAGEILYIFEGDAPWHSPESYAFFEEVLKLNQQPKSN